RTDVKVEAFLNFRLRASSEGVRLLKQAHDLSGPGDKGGGSKPGYPAPNDDHIGTIVGLHVFASIPTDTRLTRAKGYKPSGKSHPRPRLAENSLTQGRNDAEPPRKRALRLGVLAA